MEIVSRMFKKSTIVSFSLTCSFFLSIVQSTAMANGGPEQFYSIATVMSEIKESDIGTDSLLKIAAPRILYHWISIESLNRLFGSSSPPESVPLKSLGSDNYISLLVRNAPAFKDRMGLYTWHNPVGATSGGSGEVYGKNEAVLAMQIDPTARIGLVVTPDDFGVPPSDKLSDPALRDRYDVILHISGSMLGFVNNQRFGFGFAEWVVINPKIVEAISADPALTTQVMASYRNALSVFERSNIKTDLGPLEYLAGPQHTGFASYISEARILKSENNLSTNSSRIPSWLSRGWTRMRPPAKSCASVFH